MLVKLTDNFYQIVDVFDDSMLSEFDRLFADTSLWGLRPDSKKFVRRELSMYIADPVAVEIAKILEPFTLVAESIVGTLYRNAPQLWQDPPGYVNEVHVDLSPNLNVNIQVYLSNDNENAGTHVFDGNWYSVPYKRNCGYMLLNPTQISHGMKFPVITERRSLYQSYRLSAEPVNFW